jgi:ADP-heptose:LPS heptosyltransferase
MSTAFVHAVRQFYSDAQIDIVVKKELGDVAKLIPGLRYIHLFSKQEYKGLQGAYRFGKQLNAEKYDLFFNLPESLSSLVLAKATQARKRIGYGKEGGFFLLTNSYKRPGGLHRTDEYLYLLARYTGNKISKGDVSLKMKETVPQGRLVVINFNSEAVSRRMPVDKGKQLIHTLTHTFKNVKFAFVGSPKEKEFIDELLSGIENENVENFAGKTNLEGFCQLMASAKAVLTTDSGPAHLANSLGTPTIVLFGAGNEHNTAPYNKDNLAIIRAGKLDCEPCVRNTCKLYGVPKCMQLIDEITIVNALSQYLNNV